jgi:AraC family transcriptional regulator of adaptative response / DNA-3-methyladenine glycosylase II
MLERVKRLFDLRADPAAINAVLGPLAQSRPGVRLPGSFDGFEMAIRAILGQQISVAAASTLAGRIALRFGTPLVIPVAPLTRLFPTPRQLASASAPAIAHLGITGKRAATLIALARAVANGTLHLEPGSRVEETLKELRKIPGIGDWTVEYIAMRALSWPDAFPHTDMGIKKAFLGKNPKQILAPGRAMATVARLRRLAPLVKFN